MPTVKEILRQYDKTVFYPYSFSELLIDREQELLDEITRLNNLSGLGAKQVEMKRLGIALEEK